VTDNGPKCVRTSLDDEKYAGSCGSEKQEERERALSVVVSAQGAPLDFRSAISMSNVAYVATLASWGK
jgi:hypothetical protein